jgi:pimeloyl-ACP methyl ester carboxylesterase
MTSIQAATHSEQQLDTREGAVHLLRGGAGDPVLYLHGVGAEPGYWNAVHQGLSENFDVIAPDHPGFGFSDVMDDLDHIDDLVYHYLDLLDRLDLRENVHLVGISFGGWLAAELAVHSPDRFASLVLAAPLGIRIPGHLPTDIFLMTPKQRARALFHDPAKIPEADPSDPVKAFQTYKDLTGLARFGWVPFLSDPKLERRLYRVKARTLVLAAEHDAVVPKAITGRYAEAVDQAELRVLAGAGHALDAEAPEAFAAAVTEFLSQGSGHGNSQGNSSGEEA